MKNTGNTSGKDNAEKTVVCKSCGAEFGVENAKCPFCGTMYLPGAKDEYMGKLWNMHDDMKKLPEKYTTNTKKEIKKQAGSSFKLFIVLFVLAILIVIGGIVYAAYQRGLTRAEYEWQSIYFSAWDDLFRNKQYDELLESMREGREKGHDIYRYLRYDFFREYENLDYFKTILDNYEKGASDNKAMLLYCYLNAEGIDEVEKISSEEREVLLVKASSLILRADPYIDLDESTMNELRNARKTQGGYIYLEQCEEAVKGTGEGQ